jgi:exosome complex RNA-binding protein Csl4
MSTINLNEVREQIMFGKLSNEELDGILSAVRFAKAQLIQKNKNELRVGTTVKFTKSKTGAVVYGTVEKVNRKYVIVNERKANSLVGSKWRVPAYMLEAA